MPRLAIWFALVAMTAACGCKGDTSRQAPALADDAAAVRTTVPTWHDTTRKLYFGIPVTVRFVPDNPALAKSVWSYLERIDAHFNSYREDSEVGQLNRRGFADGEPVEISAQMSDAIALAKRAHRVTEGAFDITVAPLVRHWQQAARSGVVPTAAELRKVLADVGLDAVTVDTSGSKPRLVVKGRRAFDFGGLIKGIAADRAVDLLRRGGATSAFVSVGGETASFGVNAAGRPFLLAIEDPRAPDRDVRRVVAPVSGFSATTSANTRKAQVIAGTTYYHILDPRTGEPVSTRTLSATVMFGETGKAWLADALATAIPVLGPERGLAIVERLGGEALVLVDKDGKITEHATDGFVRFLAP